MSIRNAPSPAVTVTEVRDGGAQRYAGAIVRWGGNVAVVENGPTETLIEVVSRPLGQDGRPEADGYEGGRFLARFPGFLDPLIYDKERQLTVVGTVRGKVTRKIGEYPYVFPVVEVKSHYLWEATGRTACDAADEWRCDCWPYPFYRYAWPYGPYHW